MKLLLLSFLFVSVAYSAPSNFKYLTIGSDAVKAASSEINSLVLNGTKSEGAVQIIKVHEDDILSLSHFMHEEFNRCGGFMMHDSLEEAEAELKNATEARAFIPLASYSITEDKKVEEMIAGLSEDKIRNTILKLSSFHNRFYKADTGVESQEWVKSTWEELSKNRTDVTVEKFTHEKWPQPSIIMTIEGSKYPDEIIVIGGHGDSISGYFMQAKNRAPGADDNASGIATITETIRIAMENNYRPERTIKFMSYSAEEVGLLGSKDVAKEFKAKSKKVLGVMQLDMTNFKGTKDFDIALMTDYTNEAQNTFVGELIDRYVRVPWTYSKCGYGCSDHASWYSNGYPASMPSESKMSDMNRNIHTAKDTIDVSGGNAFHALTFAKLATAFLVEMGK